MIKVVLKDLKTLMLLQFIIMYTWLYFLLPNSSCPSTQVKTQY